MTNYLRPAICRTILRIAGFLVPFEHRNRWGEQWHSELLHVQRCFSPGRSFRETPLGFSLGAFPDALWMLANTEHRSLPLSSLIRSSLSCIALLGTLASITILVAFLSPQVREEVMPSGYHGPQDLAILSTGISGNDSQLVISASQFESWTHLSPFLAEGAGFYEPTVCSLEIGGKKSDIIVGRASEKLFRLLHFNGEISAIRLARQNSEVPVFLNRAAMQRYFPPGSILIGRTFEIGGKNAVVLGFAPEYADDLPGEVEAWVFEDARGISALASQRFSYGYMAAKLPPYFNGEQAEPFLAPSAAEGATDVYATLLGSIARSHRREPLLNFVHSTILACLVLPFLLSIFPCATANLKRLNWKDRVRHHLFFIAKVILLLPPIYLGSLLMSRINAFSSRDLTWALQGALTFAFVIMGVHWCLRDQVRRCPRCLCSLAHPAHVGESSRNFLSWSGLELMCIDGHGLLHVPDFRTSWFSRDRWLTLDSSWRVLFPE
jgi:hypothetical protein